MSEVRPGDRWYFAYGSNLSRDQKQARTGPIRDARRCRLPGYRWVFNKRGSSKNPVFANIVQDAGHEVWGVAYLCGRSAFEKMDTYEGVGGGTTSISKFE